MPNPPSSAIRITPVTPDRADEALRLLLRGFRKPQSFWTSMFQLARADESGHAGWFMEADGRPVGIMLAFGCWREVDGETRQFINLSSWFIEEPYRAHAPSVLGRIVQPAEVVFTDLSPSPNVQRLLKWIGFRQVFSGRWITAPFMNGVPRRGVESIHWVGPDELNAAGRDTRFLLEHHVGVGCRAGVLIADRQTVYFVVKERKCKSFRSVLLIHASDRRVFNHYIENVHRFLFLRCGVIFLLQNRLVDERPEFRAVSRGGPLGFVKGEIDDRGVDLAFSEYVYLGL